MDVNSIGGYNQYDATLKKAKKSAENQNNRHMQHANQSIAMANETGVAAQIGDEAKKLFAESNFILQEYNEDSSLKLSEDFLNILKMNREERATVLDNMIPSQEKISLDPYVQYIFPEGSLGSFLTEKLEGKVDNPSYAAREIRDMIYGGSNPGSSLEERAINRETALKVAEYISQNYFDDPEEGKAFLDGVKMFAEKSIMSEKGYIVFENSDMKPLKPYNTLSNAPEDYVSGTLNAYAKKYFEVTDTEELLKNFKSVMDAYMNDMKNNPQKIEELKSEIVRGFAEKEKSVQDVIDKTKTYFNVIGFGANFTNDLASVLNSLDKPDTAKWADDILKLFN